MMLMMNTMALAYIMTESEIMSDSETPATVESQTQIARALSHVWCR